MFQVRTGELLHSLPGLLLQLFSIHARHLFLD
jgi:hypothetical protein